MIFAAGLGTRLKPYTEKIPKALIEIGGTPMIERVILNLINAGVTDIIINLHHFPEQITSFLASKNHFGIRISFSDESQEILETGGGLKKASCFFDDGAPFFVHNTDILSDVDLVAMKNFHTQHRPLATLFTQSRNSSRYLLFDDKNHLQGWINKKTGETIGSINPSIKVRELAFNGIHIIDPKIFEQMHHSGKFSIITTYLDLAKTSNILAFEVNTAKYMDIGKIETLGLAAQIAQQIDENRTQ